MESPANAPALASDELMGQFDLLASYRTDSDVPLVYRTAWENVFRTLVSWWLEHPDESPDAMTERCVRLFSAVFGEIDPGVLTALER